MLWLQLPLPVRRPLMPDNTIRPGYRYTISFHNSNFPLHFFLTLTYTSITSDIIIIANAVIFFLTLQI